MPLVSDRALILQVYPYSDTSKILRLYCHDHGLRSVIGKGARRPKSRYGGLLELFTEGYAQFYLKEGRDLHTLSGFDLLRSRQAIGRDLGAFAGASLIAELVLRFATEEPHPELFLAVSDTLDRIVAGEGGRPLDVALAGVWRVVAMLGFHPELESCVGCGRALDADEPARFDVEAGGSACALCRPTGRVVDPGSRHELLRMSRGDTLPEGVTNRPLQRALLRVFLATHLGQGQPLRSLDLFTEQLH